MPAFKLAKGVVGLWLYTDFSISVSSPVKVRYSSTRTVATTTVVVMGIKARIAAAKASSQALPFSGNIFLP